jgi:uncharacterized membrane protein
VSEETKTEGSAPQAQHPSPPPAGSEIEQAKGTTWLSYLGILWLIPMLTLKDNSFAKWHVKQGIVLTIYWVAVSLLGSIIPFVGWFLILPIGSILLLVLDIIGIVKSLGGQYWKCPLGVSQLAEKFKF